LAFPALSGSTAPVCAVEQDLDFDEDLFFDCVSPVVDSPVNVSSIHDTSPDPSDANSDDLFTTPPLVPSPEARTNRKIIGDVSSANILSHHRRPHAFVMETYASVPAHYHQALNFPESA
jgi:hypothetical protein